MWGVALAAPFFAAVKPVAAITINHTNPLSTQKAAASVR